MDEATQTLLADVPGIDRNDPAIQAALAVMRLEKPQAPRPSAEPPYAASLFGLNRFKEAKSLLRKVIPMAQRALGKVDVTSLTLKKIHAAALCIDPSATHDDVREAVTTLEDAARAARRVFGGTHPVTMGIESNLQNSRAVLLFRDTPGAVN